MKIFHKLAKAFLNWLVRTQVFSHTSKCLDPVHFRSLCKYLLYLHFAHRLFLSSFIKLPRPIGNHFTRIEARSFHDVANILIKVLYYFQERHQGINIKSFITPNLLQAIVFEFVLSFASNQSPKRNLSRFQALQPLLHKGCMNGSWYIVFDYHYVINCIIV